MLQEQLSSITLICISAEQQPIVYIDIYALPMCCLAWPIFYVWSMRNDCVLCSCICASLLYCFLIPYSRAHLFQDWLCCLCVCFMHPRHRLCTCILAGSVFRQAALGCFTNCCLQIYVSSKLLTVPGQLITVTKCSGGCHLKGASTVLVLTDKYWSLDVLLRSTQLVPSIQSNFHTVCCRHS